MRQCAHCGEDIPKDSSYFQDIPNLGDLCKPCHVKWLTPKEDNMPKYPITEAFQARLDNTFTYHTPQADQPERYTALRDKSKELAILICEMTPPSREQSNALTKLEEVSMHANAAIARNE